MKNKVLFLGLVLALFASIPKANALTYGQLDYSTQSAVTDGSHGEYFQPIATSSLAQFSTSSPIYIQFKTEIGATFPNPIGISLRATSTSCGGSAAFDTYDNYTGGDRSLVYSSGSGTITLTINTTSTFMNILKCIRVIDINLNDYYSFGHHIYGTATHDEALYPDTGSGNWYRWYSAGADPYMGDAFFAVVGSGLTPTTSTIALTFPTASTTQDFLYSLFDFVDSTTSTVHHYEVRFAATSSALSSVASSSVIAYWSSVGGSGSSGAPKYAALSGTWYAKAFMFGNDDEDSYSSNDLLASSPVVQFTIGSPYIATGYDLLPVTTSTAADFSMTCDPTSSLWSRSWCYLFQSLFVPSTSALDGWAALKAALAHKPPFGYISAYTLALSNISTTTSAFSFPDLSGFTLLVSLRNGLAWCFYLLFAFWVFYRVRHLEL